MKNQEESLSDCYDETFENKATPMDSPSVAVTKDNRAFVQELMERTESNPGLGHHNVHLYGQLKALQSFGVTRHPQMQRSPQTFKSYYNDDENRKPGTPKRGEKLGTRIFPRVSFSDKIDFYADDSYESSSLLVEPNEENSKDNNRPLLKKKISKCEDDMEETQVKRFCIRPNNNQ